MTTTMETKTTNTPSSGDRDKGNQYDDVGTPRSRHREERKSFGLPCTRCSDLPRRLQRFWATRCGQRGARRRGQAPPKTARPPGNKETKETTVFYRGSVSQQFQWHRLIATARPGRSSTIRSCDDTALCAADQYSDAVVDSAIQDLVLCRRGSHVQTGIDRQCFVSDADARLEGVCVIKKYR